MSMTEMPKKPLPKGRKPRIKKDVEPKRRGRPTLLDENVGTAIIALLARGNYRKTAAEFVGIKPDTIEVWVSKGTSYLARMEDGEDLDDVEQLFVDFAIGVMKAEAEAEVRTVEHVVNAGIHDWRASAWLLERTKPDKFGRIDRSEVQLNQNINIDPGELSRKLQSLMSKALENNDDSILDAEIVDVPSTEILESDSLDTESPELAVDDADWDEPVGT